jgi:hypothetical protein
MNTFFSNMNDTVKKCLAIFDTSDLSNQDIIPDLSNQTIEYDIKSSTQNETCPDVSDRYGILSVLYRKYPKSMLAIFIIHILVSICALVLSWECSRMSNPIIRIITTIIATIFSELYIMYYAIYHVIMGFQCYIPIVASATKSVSLPPL